MKEVKKDILWRVYLVYVVVLVFSFFIIGQICHIQFVEGDHWRERSRQQTIDTMMVEAIRGNICAEDGSLLATSIPIFDIYWDSQVITDEIFDKNVDSLSCCLAQIFKDKTRQQFRKLLTAARKEKKEYVLIHKSLLTDESTQVTYEQLKILKTFPIFRLGKNRGGLVVDQKEKRVTPYQSLAKRTIGFEREGIFVGLEGAYSKQLEGVSGIRLRKKIAGGVWMPLNENEIEPQNGSDVITTINIDIQDVAENALRKTLIANDADHGCAILMEVETGHIKAITNLSRTSEGEYEEKYNYAIGESTEPGSTFKLFSVVAALDDGKITLGDMVPIGKTTYFDREMKDSHINGYGPVPVRRAFEISSNVGISKAIFKAYKDNPQRFIDKLYSMRINLPLGIDIGGEAMPVVKNTKNKSWSRVTLPWMSIGYEVALTPLQILSFYNTVANDGKMVKPMFVQEIRKTGKVVETKKTVVLKDSICSKKTVLQVQKLLEGVVDSGTAKHLKNSVYRIAGKTGTAQVAQNSKGYKDKGSISYKASFVGYFPADNPKYSCIVVINNPSKGAYYGGSVAAPVFKQIADRVFATQLEIHQQKNDSVYANTNIPFVKAGNQKDLYTIYKQLDFATLTQSPNALWVSVASDEKTITFKDKPFKYGNVPEVVGMGLRDALYLLESAGLKVNVSGKGKVVSQSIAAGTNVKNGNHINIVLSYQAAIAEAPLALLEVPEKDSVIVENKKGSKTEKNIKTDLKNKTTTDKKVKTGTNKTIVKTTAKPATKTATKPVAKTTTKTVKPAENKTTKSTTNNKSEKPKTSN